MDADKEKRRQALLTKCAWLYGILFLLIGVPVLFVSGPASGILLLVAGLVILPPVTRFIRDRFGFKIPRSVRVITALVCIVIAIAVLPPEKETTVVAAPVNAVSTPQGQIEKLADDAAPGTTNMSKEPHLQSVDVTQDPQGGWDVDVKLNGDDNLSENLTKQGIQQQISDEFIALYTGTTTVNKVSVEALLQLTDSYGNTKDQMVYEATLDKATASKINWSLNTDQSKALLELQILPGLWQTDYDLFAINPNL